MFQPRPTSSESMVNYSNFALAVTSRRTVTRVDDDQIAMSEAVGPVIEGL